MSQGRAPPLWLVSGRVLSAAEIRQRPRLVGGQGSSTPAPPLWACGPVGPWLLLFGLFAPIAGRGSSRHRSRLVTSPAEVSSAPRPPLWACGIAAAEVSSAPRPPLWACGVAVRPLGFPKSALCKSSLRTGRPKSLFITYFG